MRLHFNVIRFIRVSQDLPDNYNILYLNIFNAWLSFGRDVFMFCCGFEAVVNVNINDITTSLSSSQVIFGPMFSGKR